jgi:hypothetical protein
LIALDASPASAQSTLQRNISQVKSSIAKNQQMLALYTWEQQETVSVRGDVKKQALYQVQLGADGKPVKVDISQTQSSNRRQWGIRHRISQNYIDYGKQIAALAGSYAQPDPGRLQQLYGQGQVSVKYAGTPGVYSLVVRNYAKPGDVVTLTFAKAQRALLGIQVASYLDGPSAVVTMSAAFSKLPDGTNHVSVINIDGQSKSLTIQESNVNYQRRS